MLQPQIFFIPSITPEIIPLYRGSLWAAYNDIITSVSACQRHLTPPLSMKENTLDGEVRGKQTTASEMSTKQEHNILVLISSL